MSSTKNSLSSISIYKNKQQQASNNNNDDDDNDNDNDNNNDNDTIIIISPNKICSYRQLILPDCSKEKQKSLNNT